MYTIENEMLAILNHRLKKLNSIYDILLKDIQNNKNNNSVKISSCRGHYYWYEKSNDNEEYNLIRDEKKIRVMVQADYNKRAIKYIEKEIKCIKKTLGAISTFELEKLFCKTHKSRQLFIEPIKYELTDDEYIKKFLKTPQCTLGFDEKAPHIYSKKGLRVRSKSEADIADCLDAHNIPFLYEPAIIINGRKVHPDFVCINVRTRTMYIWEHLGSMDNSEYVNTNALPKVKDYQNAGYITGKNLIFTMESLMHPFYSQQAEMTIQNYLI